MKKTGIIICVLACFQTQAQSDPFFSHYMFNPSYYNPGWMGDIQTGFASFQHRSQWAGYTSSFDGAGGSPSSQQLSFIVPTNGLISTTGINIIRDMAGPIANVWVRAGGAYNFEIRQGVISVGLMPGLVSQSLNFNQLRFEDPNDPFAKPQGNETQIKPDLAAGIFFNSFTGYFAGIGVGNLLSPKFNYNISTSGGKDNQFKKTYYFHGGKKIQINRDFEVTTTLLLKTDLAGYSVDVGGITTYKNIAWSGITYRKSEAVVLLIGYSLLPNKELKVGYSFDYVIKDREAKSPTSHEIFVRYDLPELIFGGRKEVKTPRFSF